MYVPHYYSVVCPGLIAPSSYIRMLIKHSNFDRLIKSSSHDVRTQVLLIPDLYTFCTISVGSIYMLEAAQPGGFGHWASFV